MPLPPPLLHVVLDRPKIAGNIGAIARLCAGTGCALHVCGPLVLGGPPAKMARPGLDYWRAARVHFHLSLGRCLALLDAAPYVVEVGGEERPDTVALGRGRVVVFGPEDGSVDARVLDPARADGRVLSLPLVPGARSLNLAQCAAVTVYEAVRQQGGVCADLLGFDI